jgi:hypothetical protein
MFSTNSIAHSDRIIDFAKKIDEITDHPFILSVQFSYDGDESTNEIRYADSSIIYKNIVYVITELNKINFKHTSIKLYFHGVISLDLLNRLDSYEKME